ncbi:MULTISPECIES: SMI1/KNR4 family protein [Psychrobacter]|uniref:SMI1 / KNR4 family n=2 Tax=Psychrobacter TaxID=497 RepID=A0A379LQ02_9GAMM|nr:SMI1/KNR4 family protein [Psychrobacter phenylpyruvicus]SUD91844.1 SMI1 / KNR4 family [Psychrobacter phenylpyruvicus]
MKTNITGFGQLTNSEIEAFEKQYSINLPQEFRSFLMKYNGGKVYPETFVFHDKTDASSISYFLGIGLKEYYYNLSYTFDMFRDRVPNNLFPIARDPGGNLILVGLSGKELGKIYFWDHEFEADGNKPDMSNVHYLSSSLDTFLNELYEYGDHEIEDD